MYTYALYTALWKMSKSAHGSRSQLLPQLTMTDKMKPPTPFGIVILMSKYGKHWLLCSYTFLVLAGVGAGTLRPAIRDKRTYTTSSKARTNRSHRHAHNVVKSHEGVYQLNVG